MFNVIPAIDLLKGRVVRLRQGDYAQVTYYDQTPEALAKQYEDWGATRIHLVDLDGAKEGRGVNLEVVKAIRGAVSCELELGGGLRDQASVETILELGINYAVLGSMLVKDLDQACDIIKAFPGQVIAGIDIKNNQIAVEGWLETSEMSLKHLCDTLAPLPVAEIICTHVARDGMLTGPDIEGLKELELHTQLPIIASGGVGDKDDIDELKALYPRISGCIVGKALLDGHIDGQVVWKKLG